MTMSDHSHRHESGHLRVRRGARRRQQELCADAQEPASSVRIRATSTRFFARSSSSAATRVRAAACAASRWPCGTWRAKPTTSPVYQTAGRQVSRYDPLLRRHHRVATIRRFTATRLKARRDEKGFTWLKMDLGVDLVENVPGALTRPLGTESRQLRRARAAHVHGDGTDAKRRRGDGRTTWPRCGR